MTIAPRFEEVVLLSLFIRREHFLPLLPNNINYYKDSRSMGLTDPLSMCALLTYLF